jgi:hypothetical protein
VIQAPGLGGSPSPGHLRRARANASCTASSATSMSPKMRIRVATDRPDSSWKIRPTAASSTLGPASASASRTLSGPWFVPERANLDRSPDDGGGLGRPCERGVEVLSGHDVKAAEVFLRLHKGPVGRQHLAAGHAHDGCSVRFGQAAADGCATPTRQRRKPAPQRSPSWMPCPSRWTRRARCWRPRERPSPTTTPHARGGTRAHAAAPALRRTPSRAAADPSSRQSGAWGPSAQCGSCGPQRSTGPRTACSAKPRKPPRSTTRQARPRPCGAHRLLQMTQPRLPPTASHPTQPRG